MARQRLIERRHELGLSRQELADAITASVKTVARYERGESGPRPGAPFQAYADALKWTPTQLAVVLAGIPDNGQQMVPGWLSVYITWEQSALSLREYEPTIVPGLLQTAGYAEAILRSDVDPRSDEEVGQLVAMRLGRQAILHRDEDPLKLTVVLDEAVLRRPAGEVDVMADQLEHLVDVGQLPNVSVQVIPLEQPAHPIGFGAFVILGLALGLELVYQENRAGAHYLDAADACAKHSAVFSHLAGLALSPEESEAAILAIKESYT